MKLALVTLAYAVALVQPAFAAEGKQACHTIKLGCRAVTGYVKGKDDHKAEYKACLATIYGGGSVSGVNVDAATVQSCQAYKAEKGKDDEDGNPFN